MQNQFFQQEVMAGKTAVDGSQWTSRALERPEAAVARARFLAHMGRKVEAEALLAVAAGATPEAPAVLEVKAILQASSGDSAGALASYKRALELGSVSATAHFEVARDALNGPPDMDRLGEAQALLERAVALGPAFAPAYALLGEVLLAKNVDAGRAFTVGMRAVELSPGEVHGYVVAGRAALRLDRVPDAIKLAQRAMVVSDSDEDRALVDPLLREAQRRLPR